jgi:hypothetical protein
MGRPRKDEGNEAAVMQAQLDAVRQELAITQKKLAEQDALNASLQKLGGGLSSEIAAIRKKGNSSANTITVGSSRDYTPVNLWTPWGKPIGRQHPDNAIQSLHRFAAVGIKLSVTKPTPEQATAWSNSPEGKAYWEKEAKKRARKDKTRKAGTLEKLTAEIAKQTGQTAEALNRILKPHEVQSLAEK